MIKNSFPFKTLLWITVFSIAMGYLETSVVVYLRALLYPMGFSFPLSPMSASLIVTEILREAATLLMLLGAGVMAGRTLITRFAWVMYAFAIWDIFYYVFLKALLGWPESFFTWDLLFLIPVTWTGPVLAPIINSLTMIGFALLIIQKSCRSNSIKIDLTNWLLLTVGSLVIIISYTLDYLQFVSAKIDLSKIFSIPKDLLLNISFAYVPNRFNWIVFWIGELIIIFAIIKFYRRK
jgi:hypothetical protein